MDEQKVNEDSLESNEPDKTVEPTTESAVNEVAPVVEQPAINPVEPVVTVQQQPATTSTIPTETPTQPALTTIEKPKSSKPKWFLPAVFAGLLVLGGGAAAYLTVFQKTADSAWKSALKNTADGLDEYLNNSMDVNQKGFKLEGSLAVSSPIAVDGSMSGQWYETDGEMKADIGTSGARINAEFKTIKPEGGKTPDLYMKVDGLEGIDTLLSSFGASDYAGVGEMLSSVNDQWFFIDHTLIDQATASSESTGLELSEAEIKAIADKVSVVLRDRMFSTSSDKAIFTIAEKLGKEDFESTSTFKVRVAVDKENFKQFVTALKDALKDTKAEELLKAGQTDKTLEEALDFENMIKDLEDADFSKASADVWIEANGGYVRNVRVYPTEDKKDTNYLDFGLNYTGGDLFPFVIKATVDEDGDKGTFTFGLEVNKTNGDAKMSFNLDMNVDGGDIKAEGDLSISGSNEDTNVEKPTDAKNIFELIGGLGALQSDFGLDDYGTEVDPLYDPSLYEIDPTLYDDLEL